MSEALAKALDPVRLQVLDEAAARIAAFGSALEALTAPLVISDEAFAYLKVQRGRIADLAGDRAAWERAYRIELAETYHAIAPHLPERCFRILDIGSGLGGIDILLSRHYGCTAVTLLDGEADAPEVARHSETFNDMGVARRFLEANGAHMSGYYTPRLTGLSPSPPPCDLIVSFQAWGFHIEPRVYLDFVRARLAPGGRLILDLRRGRPAWLAQLLEVFDAGCIARRFDKFDRMVFAAR